MEQGPASRRIYPYIVIFTPCLVEMLLMAPPNRNPEGSCSGRSTFGIVLTDEKIHTKGWSLEARFLVYSCYVHTGVA